MDFTELVSNLAERHAVEGLAAVDGQADIDIDGIPVTLVEDGWSLIAIAEIGIPPAEGRAEFAEILLESNLESAAFFAKTRESGNYVLVQRIALSDLDADTFDAVLQSLANTAETWRNLLADFHPAADQPAADRAAAEDANFNAFGAGGFIQV